MSALEIPELALVALVGASGSGKSTFAAEHFGRYEVVSSDVCRGMVSDDETDQDATKDAFEVLSFVVGKRLDRGRLTVVDATNAQRDARKHVVELARAHDVLPVAIVLDLPEDVCLERNRGRGARELPERVVTRQRDLVRRAVGGLAREGFRQVHVLRSVEEAAQATIVRTRLHNDLRDEHGPFDVIGDVHGCRSELETLLVALGYQLRRDDEGRPVDAAHPEGRKVVFLGDLVDRGPDTPGVLRLAMGMTANGNALAVPGNHEHKLVRALNGKAVTVSHGLESSLEQLAAEGPELSAQVRSWADALVSHLVLDEGKLVVAHAGLKEAYHGRTSGRVRSFALYGDTTGETDEFGLPVRYPWADEYRGRAMVLYGHTPTPVPQWVNHTMCLDTGVVFGGHLTALRYPSKELVQVPAEQVWYEPAKPFLVPAQPRPDDVLDIEDVLGRRSVETRHHGRITIEEDNAVAALEVMSRFALHPRWVPYLPPTMAPVATSPLPGLLEHPAEAFSAFAAAGVQHVICEEKHMGSRATVLVCRDGFRWLGAPDGETGAVWTRTGRAFFDRPTTEVFLAGVRSAVTAAGLWDELGTDWLLLDGELLPWSLKAGPLLREQYAATGAAARAMLPAAVSSLEVAAARGLDVGDLLDRTVRRTHDADAFVDAYRRYVWPTDGLDGVQLAPFQVLAAEGSTFHDRDHGWHLSLIDRLVEADPVLFRRTGRLEVDVSEPADGIAWWESLTAAGGEGMVVKPFANLVHGRRGLVQPGLKVRGPEYLRIIYGPEYTQHLDRLKVRSLGRKRGLALREYALGLESLDRLAAGEPLWRVHEPVFAVLALESEPVDPRL